MIPLLRAFIAPLVYCLLASTSTRLVRRTVCTSAAVSVLLLSLAAPNAGAGVFKVATCQADPLNYSTRAFTLLAA